MKKSWCLALGLVLFLAVGVVATSPIPEAVENAILDKGFDPEKIDGITSVNYEDLPEQINIESIDDTNLEIYEVNIENEKMYVLTYGGEQIEKSAVDEKRQFLIFGVNGKLRKDSFLKSVGGVEMSIKKGYVMMRDGSITGISTNLDVTEAISSGRVEIVIYKNGEAINFGNEVSASSEGVHKDYDVQSNGIVTFEAGDTISVYADSHGEVSLKDVITMIEITTN